jgi:hypothetical protein
MPTNCVLAKNEGGKEHLESLPCFAHRSCVRGGGRAGGRARFSPRCYQLAVISSDRSEAIASAPPPSLPLGVLRTLDGNWTAPKASTCLFADKPPPLPPQVEHAWLGEVDRDGHIETHDMSILLLMHARSGEMGDRHAPASDPQ